MIQEERQGRQHQLDNASQTTFLTPSAENRNEPSCVEATIRNQTRPNAMIRPDVQENNFAARRDLRNNT
jgi:hypothetical protein